MRKTANVNLYRNLAPLERAGLLARMPDAGRTILVPVHQYATPGVMRCTRCQLYLPLQLPGLHEQLRRHAKRTKWQHLVLTISATGVCRTCQLVYPRIKTQL